MSDDVNPRRPLIAALLSLGLPGLGQLYNGDLNRAIWLFLAFVLAGSPGVTVAALYVPSVLMLPVLLLCVGLTLAIWVVAVITAWRQAARCRLHARHAWQASGVYALVLLGGNLLIQLPLITEMRDHMVQSFTIPSASMEPGIRRGDILFADKRYNCPSCKTHVSTGDIGIFVYPNDRTQYYIKRVIGLPGDRVQISNHQVSINGKSLTLAETTAGARILGTEGAGGRTWHVQWNAAQHEPDVDLTVPAGTIFLLGDNRDASSDSRQFGTVPLADLVGKARQVWFSHGPDGIRWGRLGMVLE